MSYRPGRNQTYGGCDAYSLYLQSLNDDITNYYLIVSSSIGIPGNLISLIIFCRLVFTNKTNMGFLYACQTSVDLFLLMANLFLIRSTPLIFASNLTNLTDSTCKLITFLKRFCNHASSWMTVIITFDRFIFVIYKTRFRWLQRKRALICLILLVFAFITVLDTPNLLFYLSANRNITFETYRRCVGNTDATVSADLIGVIMRTYAPFLVMMIFNALMIQKIMKSSRASLKQNVNSRKEYFFTVAVMAFDVYFFILNAPESIFYVFYDINLYSGTFLSNNGFRLTYTVLLGIFTNLSMIVQTLSIVMYVGFNRIFRRECLNILSWVGERVLKITKRTPLIWPDTSVSSLSKKTPHMHQEKEHVVVEKK